MEFLHLRTEYAAGSQLDFVMKQAVLIVIQLAVYLKPKISEKFSPSPVVKVMYSCGVSVCIPAQKTWGEKGGGGWGGGNEREEG